MKAEKNKKNLLKKFKEKLEKERKLLLAQLKQTELPQEFGSDSGDVDEESDEAEALSLKISEAQTLRNRINEIDYLINKINSGTYGFCDKCKNKIPEEKLLINPEIILCVNCEKNKKAKKK